MLGVLCTVLLSCAPRVSCMQHPPVSPDLFSRVRSRRVAQIFVRRPEGHRHALPTLLGRALGRGTDSRNVVYDFHRATARAPFSSLSSCSSEYSKGTRLSGEGSAATVSNYSQSRSFVLRSVQILFSLERIRTDFFSEEETSRRLLRPPFRSEFLDEFRRSRCIHTKMTSTYIHALTNMLALMSYPTLACNRTCGIENATPSTRIFNRPRFKRDRVTEDFDATGTRQSSESPLTPTLRRDVRLAGENDPDAIISGADVVANAKFPKGSNRERR